MTNDRVCSRVSQWPCPHELVFRVGTDFACVYHLAQIVAAQTHDPDVCHVLIAKLEREDAA